MWKHFICPVVLLLFRVAHHAISYPIRRVYSHIRSLFWSWVASCLYVRSCRIRTLVPGLVLGSVQSGWRVIEGKSQGMLPPLLFCSLVSTFGLPWRQAAVLDGDRWSPWIWPVWAFRWCTIWGLYCQTVTHRLGDTSTGVLLCWIHLPGYTIR